MPKRVNNDATSIIDMFKSRRGCKRFKRFDPASKLSLDELDVHELLLVGNIGVSKFVDAGGHGQQCPSARNFEPASHGVEHSAQFRVVTKSVIQT